MKRAQFNALVTRLENFAAVHPTAYALRVAALAAVGYAYLFLILGIVIACFAIVLWSILAEKISGAGVIKIEFILGAFAVVILRALWVRFPRPVGIKLRPDQVPAVHRFVDELRQRLRAPRFSYVLLTNEFNAAVLQRPLLGIFGMYENYLLLGLPLMEALTPEQFRAVVAHEMGHLSGNHGRFSAWIYRVRQAWGRLATEFQHQRTFGSRMFTGFVEWYAPFFDAYSFVLARRHEYEADRCAAEVTSARTAAEALVYLRLKQQLLDESFWPRTNRQMAQQPDPPARLISELSATVRGAVPATDAAEWLKHALAEATGQEDTHPSLSDRLKALGEAVAPEMIFACDPDATAAAHFLGESRASFAAALDERWQKESAEQWRQQHEQAKAVLEELRQLNERAARETLPVADAWRRVCLTGEYESPAAGGPLLEQFMAAHPEHAAGSFLLGRLLLERGDERGLALLEKAMGADAEYVLPGCELISHFLRSRGRLDELPAYQRRAEQNYDLIVAAQQERASVSDRDKFVAHELPAEVIADLRDQLAKHDTVASAYLLRKSVKHLPERPLFLLVVTMEEIWYKYSTDAKYTVLAETLAKEIRIGDHAFHVLVAPKRGHVLVRKARRSEGSCVFLR